MESGGKKCLNHGELYPKAGFFEMVWRKEFWGCVSLKQFGARRF
jgi:hypothetical protein